MLTDLLWGMKDREEARAIPKVFFLFVFCFVFSRVPESIELRLTKREEAGGVFAGVIAHNYHL